MGASETRRRRRGAGGAYSTAYDLIRAVDAQRLVMYSNGANLLNVPCDSASNLPAQLLRDAPHEL
eukprot:CAMPEP_0173467096 /NCGR_PEP_ID=MMETSP1357-20121228/74478_1 /TAXON_ID=77926 /ORGANISM="Hemiselmis rufescens, Strain PCC563" /LENGTH=64 /DNA_ID=CAMNT_0014435205 /DNA_START=141 /DNA_END=331 /DNA_ORIENTATION=-